MAPNTIRVTNEQALILTHTARMIVVMQDNAEHPRKDEYAATINRYRAQWKALDADTQKAIAIAVEGNVHDMPEELVSAAVSLLEG